MGRRGEGEIVLRPFSEVVKEEAAALVRDRGIVAAGGEVLTQLDTGLRDLDANGGLDLGVLTLIAGETGEGKSVVKLHLARAVASLGHKVISLDFEDPAHKTAQRDLARATGIPAFRLSRLQFPESDNARILAAAAETESWGSRLLHYSGLLTARQVRAVLAAHPDARLVLVDYMQALPGREGLEREIADLAWDLNEDAQKNKRAVVMFSQVTRKVQERGAAIFARTGKIDGYRPGPGKDDIAWATAAGERAKAFWFIYRPGRWAQKMGLAEPRDDRMEIIVAKANWALEGTVEVGWDGARASLFDLKRKT